MYDIHVACSKINTDRAGRSLNMLKSKLNPKNTGKNEENVNNFCLISNNHMKKLNNAL